MVIIHRAAFCVWHIIYGLHLAFTVVLGNIGGSTLIVLMKQWRLREVKFVEKLNCEPATPELPPVCGPRYNLQVPQLW